MATKKKTAKPRSAKGEAPKPNIVKIRNRWDGSVIWEVEAEDLGASVQKAVDARAVLDGANLVGANLDGARLVGASLVGADLDGARLVGADLDGARLDGARLDGANLDGATGLNANRHQPLLMLLDQPGAIRAYKLVTGDYRSPTSGAKLDYHIGAELSEPGADRSVMELCGSGLHVATLPWVMREWRPDHRILVVEFTAADIAAIPTASDGKFRVSRLKVVGEKDLVELGLIKKEEAAK